MASAALLPARSLLVQPQQSSPRPPASLRVCLSRHNEPSPDPKRRRDPVPSHPAFSPAARRRAKKIPIADTGEPAAGVRVTDCGLAYRLDGAPFEFQYSYTEAPRARPVALREAPYLPFGPEATPRPWTGRKPLPKSRKEMPELDSFVLPPPGKKGVKPVQSPGPFLAGMEPRYQAESREEVLGEPLTKEEIAELVNGSLKTKRQLNIGGFPTSLAGTLEPSLSATSTGDELEATRKDNKDITGRDILNYSSKVPSYTEGVVLFLKQAIDNGSAVVLNETEFVDYNLVYQKSVALAKSAPRGPVFHDTQRRSNARRNGPDKHVRIKKHLVENKISSHVEKKDNGNGGLAIQTSDHAQEFLSDVVPQGTLRVDELAKLLA